MKRLSVYLIAILLPLIANAQYDDDMYFGSSSKKSKTESVKDNHRKTTSDESIVSSTSNMSDIEVYNSTARDEDEYNRRYNYTDYQGTANQDSDMASNVEYIDDDKKGDYDINDDEDDYRYSRRILRFHSPNVGVIVSSPYYWDLVYVYGAYDFLYSDYYYYDPFFWGPGWGYSWGWRPWHSWYSPIWGYHYHYSHWHHWGYGPMWGHYHRPNGIYPRHYSGGYYNSHIVRANNHVYSSRYNRGSRIRSGVSAISARGVRASRTSALGGRTGYASVYNGGVNQDGRRSINGRTSIRTISRDRESYDRTTTGRTSVSGRTSGRGGAVDPRSRTERRSNVNNTERGSRVNRENATDNGRRYNTSSSSSRTSTNRQSTSERNERSSRSYERSRTSSDNSNSQNTYTPSRTSSSSSSSRSYTPSTGRSGGGSFGGGGFGGGNRGGSVGGGGARGGRR